VAFSLLGCLPPLLLVLGGIVLVIIGTVNLNAQKKRPGLKTFAGVKEEFGRLKAQFDAHALSEAQFKARLQELMVQDAQGRWWMIGYETGQWYVHDGQHWNPGQPDVGGPMNAQSAEAAKKATAGARNMRLIGLIALIAGAIWSCLAGIGYYALLSSNNLF
jgi:hypothetical protein